MLSIVRCASSETIDSDSVAMIVNQMVLGSRAHEVGLVLGTHNPDAFEEIVVTLEQRNRIRRILNDRHEGPHVTKGVVRVGLEPADHPIRSAPLQPSRYWKVVGKPVESFVERMPLDP